MLPADAYYSLNAQKKLKAGQSLDNNERDWVTTRYQNYTSERPFWDSLGWNTSNQWKTSAPDPANSPFPPASPAQPAPADPGTGLLLGPTGATGDVTGMSGGSGPIDMAGGAPPAGGNNPEIPNTGPMKPGGTTPGSEVDPNQSEPFKNFDFYTGQGTVGDLSKFSDYLDKNAGEAYRYALYQKFGPLNQLSDNYRNYALNMERNATMGRDIRKLLPAGDPSKLTDAHNPVTEFRDMLNAGEMPYSANQFRGILSRLFNSPDATNAGSGLYKTLAETDSQGRPLWYRYAMFGMDPGSQLTRFYYNNPSELLNAQAGTKWLDVLRRLFPQVA